jgi:hypothetical protein
MRVPTKYWYEYITTENQNKFYPALQETIRFHYHLWLELQSLRRFKDVARMLRDVRQFLKGRLWGARPLLKDPFALLSAPWFANVLSCQVVISVRHPLAFVSSLKRLGWHFDFRDFLSQPLLMRDYLEPFRDDLLAVPNDIIAQGSLLWRMLYTVVAHYQNSNPEFLIVRHEDLSQQPETGFRDLFKYLGLAFSPKAQRALLDSSRRSNPSELSTHRRHAVKLNSQANLTNWKSRLDGDEIDRILLLTGDVRERFYSDESWE